VGRPSSDLKLEADTNDAILPGAAMGMAVARRNAAACSPVTGLQLHHRGAGQRPAGGDGLLELHGPAGEDQGLVAAGAVQLGDRSGAQPLGERV
jgi:hypothetical protein